MRKENRNQKCNKTRLMNSIIQKIKSIGIKISYINRIGIKMNPDGSRLL